MAVIKRRFASFAFIIPCVFVLVWYTNLNAGPHQMEAPQSQDIHPPSPDKPTPAESWHGMPVVEDLDSERPEHHLAEDASGGGLESLESPTLPTEKSLMDAVERLLQTASEDQSKQEHNRKSLQGMVECMHNRHCERNLKLVILGSADFGNAVGHEASILGTFDNLKVFYIYSARDIVFAHGVHALFPSYTRAVIFDRPELTACVKDTKGCLRSPENQDGIPLWKMFNWNQIPDADPVSPFGFAWTFTGELFNHGETYVGYNVERSCRDLPYVPSTERSNRAFILANLEAYFHHPKHNNWPPKYFEDAGAEAGAQLVASLDPVIARLEQFPEVVGKQVPSSLVELGWLPPRGVLEEISKSKLLVGLWDPREQALVYEALCLGVPFLNPIRSWDANNPNDTSKWLTQNMGLNEFGPPYVYHVFTHDYEGFKKAIADAMTHPIQRFIPDRMTNAALEKRLSAILERDWKTEARAVLDAQKASGKPQDFLL
ncbi:hypothetical protein DFH06DRAFT_266483 [Mycena polygramma]|nr:hypothetical protein DFH06DRAFT_266483 [Mycena polygramma]